MSYEIIEGDSLESLKAIDSGSVDCAVTSPPYFGLRDYGVDGQIGVERSLDDYITRLVAVFREVRRTLRKDGSLWLNIGDSYNAYNGNRGQSTGLANRRHHEIMPALPTGAGLTVPTLKNKDLIGVPWMLAFALRADGWHLRQDIIWHKPNPMPESATGRCTKAHEYLFLLTPSQRYYYNADAVAEPGVGVERRNKRSVWTVPLRPGRGQHSAAYPEELVEPCVLAGSRPGGVVLDPFGGSGTTAVVALRHGRRAVLCELNPDYVALARSRVEASLPADRIAA